jgi:hypothetical protein
MLSTQSITSKTVNNFLIQAKDFQKGGPVITSRFVIRGLPKPTFELKQLPLKNYQAGINERTVFNWFRDFSSKRAERNPVDYYSFSRQTPTARNMADYERSLNSNRIKSHPSAIIPAEYLVPRVTFAVSADPHKYFTVNVNGKKFDFAPNQRQFGKNDIIPGGSLGVKRELVFLLSKMKSYINGDV